MAAVQHTWPETDHNNPSIVALFVLALQREGGAVGTVFTASSAGVCAPLLTAGQGGGGTTSNVALAAGRRSSTPIQTCVALAQRNEVVELATGQADDLVGGIIERRPIAGKHPLLTGVVESGRRRGHHK